MRSRLSSYLFKSSVRALLRLILTISFLHFAVIHTFALIDNVWLSVAYFRAVQSYPFHVVATWPGRYRNKNLFSSDKPS